ncbi:L-aminoadipate-semialdehyde dehydrogenase-phosphopantetheinyl transferase [Biomphalaria glabrata]|nr:L-aminoadipate-semialdehyde dehydrogenase-phosphopantetheinyl transferase [Biomphalaria glabrata]
MLSGRSVRIAVKYRSWNPTQQEWKLAAQCVQVEEKERIGKFVFKRDAKSAMVGRLVMRYAMSRILNVPSRTLRFSRTDKGKPFLLSPIDRTTPRCDVSFNISHHGDYVVFVAECGRLVGVDTMKIEWQRNKPIKDFLTTMEDQLTSVEWKQVKQFTSDLDQLKTFLRFWCLKESLVKTLGTGIGFDVSRLNFQLKTAEVRDSLMVRDTQVEIDDEPALEWHFEETMLEDHCVAVAIQDKNFDKNEEAPSFRLLDIQDILSACEPLTGSSPDQEYWELFSSREEEPGLR